MYTIQEITFGPDSCDYDVKKLYIREFNNAFYSSKEDAYVLLGTFDLVTLFNSISIKKWKKYTSAHGFHIEIKVKGEFGLTVVGHHYDGIRDCGEVISQQFY